VVRARVEAGAMTVRVFIAGTAAAGVAELDAAESHYLRRVRRAADGAVVEAIDDAGTIWIAEVAGGDARRSTLRLVGERPAPAIARELVLLLGMPEPSALLDLLPAVCEVGVAEIVLVRCMRTQGGAPGRDRIDRVLRAAQRQCGRPRSPAVHGPLSLEAALRHRAELPGFFAWEQLRAAASTTPPIGAGARLCVGPEGGFAEPEVAALAAAGFHALGLGPYVLRTGTAAVVGLARLLFA
jgi:16S rRNA (uracil1498-N3)-methyltransferase